MPAKITTEIIESYLTCRYKGSLQLSGERGVASDYDLLLRESRDRMRKDAAAKLVHEQRDFLQGIVVTFEVLRRGVPLLLDMTYEEDQLKIRFDGLRRSNGSSRLGDFHYIPIVVYEGKRPGKEQKALLEVLALFLATVQGKEPQWGILIYGRDCEIHKVKLGRGISQAQRMLNQIREMRETENKPTLRLNPHCQICEFRKRCQSEALSKDDISLLRGMSENEVSKYNRRGIFTVTQLSCTFRPKKRVPQRKQQDQPHQHALQALAIRDKKIYVLGSPELPNSTVRIFFDVEGDPERGFDYLVGMIVEAGDINKKYSFWADSSAEEPLIFQRFLDVVSVHEDFRLYSYGGYDTAFLRRMMKSSGREELVKSILARSVNVLSIIRAHIYFPTYSNSLKDVGRYLRYEWNEPDASGIQSIVWRRQWEEMRSKILKKKLITYNFDDCVALQKVTQFLYALCPSSTQTLGGQTVESVDGYQVSLVEQIDPQFRRPDWREVNFVIKDFDFVNERAYFDYQQDKVFIRTNTARKRRMELQRSARKRGKNRLPVNRTVKIVCLECPSCGGSDLGIKPDGRLSRLAYDLVFSPSGVRRRVTRYTTSWHQCGLCGTEFLPQEYLTLEEHCHSLKSWAMYMHVAHRMTFGGIAETLYDCYGLPLYTPDIWSWKAALAHYYEPTYELLLKRMVAGHLIHADETDVHLARVGKGYVWVFASLEEVVFIYRKSREGGFLSELLKDFRGVLVSDFYAAYDSIDCEQQKCLIHLLRDFNNALLSSPWDEELKEIGSQLGVLLRTIIATVDRYGLRRRNLRKHQRDVDVFYESLSKQQCGRSELAEGYRRRMLKYRNKLFTFLDHDDVPWNNNNAEHAVKRFAKYRALVDGRYGEAGLHHYLVLLSIYVTCEFKRVDFLRFLLSREIDIDAYALTKPNGTPAPKVEVYAPGVQWRHPSRKQTWERQALRKQRQDSPKGAS